MKLSKIITKEIDKKVSKYIKSLDEKDDEGVVTGTKLANTPECLNAFFRSGIYSELTKEEGLYAKTKFKEKLPYKEWRQSIRDNPDQLTEEILRHQELDRKGRI